MSIPEFLYKIMLPHYWSDTLSSKSIMLPGNEQDAVILLSHDQLESVIQTKWADCSEIVVLKLSSDKLQGRLAYDEATTHYHLQQGLIPFGAIQEARTIFQKSHQPQTPTLEIVNIGHKALRQPARELTKEEILSPQIQQLIEDLKATMRAAPGVGLAAPQVGLSLQLAVVEDMDHEHLTEEHCRQRDRRKFPFHVVINPRIFIDETENITFPEGCCSVPELVAYVPRAKSIRVECLNERAEPVTLEAQGWYARILQHEIDHLFGTIFLDRAIQSSLMTTENYVRYWQKLPPQEVLTSLLPAKAL